MITLKQETAEMIRQEMNSIPEKYQKPFNSIHEGLAVLREEYVELENEIFFGEKKCKAIAQIHVIDGHLTDDQIPEATHKLHKERIRDEAIQVAAMACRIIQELT